MSNKKFSFRVLCLTCLTLILGITGSWQCAVAASTSPAGDVNGTWSGTFISKNPRRSPFTMTVSIAPGTDGELLGTTSVAAECFRDLVLHVVINGSKVVLAGSDENGSSVTFKGALDGSGTILNLDYIVRGSGGKCESDVGAGSVGKR
jgi:hypothetical protein